MLDLHNGTTFVQLYLNTRHQELVGERRTHRLAVEARASRPARRPRRPVARARRLVGAAR